MSKAELSIQGIEGGVRLALRVAPRAKREGVVGVHEGALKVALRAPPVEGAANAALIKLLSKALRIPKSAVVIEAGERGRDKRLRLMGVGVNEVHNLLGE